MIDRLYRTFVPKRVRSMIYQGVRSKVYDDVIGEINYRDSLRNEIDFYVDISSRHIKDLEVIINREAMLKLMPKNSVVAELGVFDGEFSSQIISITRPQKLHLIDVWDEYDHRIAVEKKFDSRIKSGTVEINQGYSTAELEKFPDRYFDWVYIDTDHSYKNTAQELELCSVKTKEDGIIAGHDFIKGHWRGKLRYGVIEAVHQFCSDRDWKIIYLTHEGHRHLSYAITKIHPG